MENKIFLTEDEKDCLQELMNVAYGSATAAITEILDAFAKLSIPKIQIINANEFQPYLSKELDLEEEHLISLQQIKNLFHHLSFFYLNHIII